MAMKLAFSTVACPEWTLEKVAQQAEAWGYQGVELRTLGSGGAVLACDPCLSDPLKVRNIFKAHGVEPVCLSTSLSFHQGDESAARNTLSQVKRDLDLAAQIGCSYVRVFGSLVEPGENRIVVMRRIGERLRVVAEYASAVGVRVLAENAGSFSKAKDWWHIMNLIDHPMIGLSWNVANAAAAGEPASVSVPMLNSRVSLVKVKDTHVGEGSGFVPLGDGTVGIEPFIHRLMGIGYQGYMSVEWDRLWLPSLAPAGEYLPKAQEKLKGWLDSIAGDVAKGQAAVAKMAAKNAPKPRAAVKAK
jgi:sugar phosphate isomerase/epimerase